MTAFVLILSIWWHSGTAITTHRFLDEASCRAALAEFTKAYGTSGSRGVCVPEKTRDA